MLLYTHALGMLAGLLLASGCRRESRSRAGTASSTAGVVPALNLAPLRAKDWLIELDVTGFGSAALAVPLGATEPRPIVIALHGNADRPEWACGAWRGVVGPKPFVLCPRGVLQSDASVVDARYTLSSVDTTAQELRAALAALKQKFGLYVAPGSVVAAGFEIGADQVASIARQEPTFFSRLALVNPASETWPSSQAALFGRQGGQRVLFACGSGSRSVFELKAVLTRRGGADARAIFLGDPTPPLGALTVSKLAAAWPWLSAANAQRSPPENLAGNPLSAKGPPAPVFR